MTRKCTRNGYNVITGMINTPLHLPGMSRMIKQKASGKGRKKQLGMNVNWSHANCVTFSMQFSVIVC